MDRWEWTKIGAGVGLAGSVMATGLWVGSVLVSPVYPQQRGYAVAGVPPVDLVAVQRDWPVGGSTAEREQLKGYIGHIEKAVAFVPADTGMAAAEEPVDLGTLLASADPEKGRRTAQVCMACHDLSQNGPNRIGPNLWGVVGRPVAAHAGFAYSPALKGMGGAWTYQQLDHFLAGPGRAVPGTKMSFTGIRNPRERAHVLAYLATIGTSRVPFPQPVAAAPPAAEKVVAGTP
jgi:cytochrome c